jgi:hypothetical protein
MDPSKQIQAEAEAEAEVIPEDNGKCLQDTPALGKNWGKIIVSTDGRKVIGKMTVPCWLGTPKKPPRLEAKVRLSKENISPAAGEPAPGRKTFSVWQAWKAMRNTRTDQAPFCWAPMNQ